eukprot:757650-Alexandrium_andersonii.AAC.1
MVTTKRAGGRAAGASWGRSGGGGSPLEKATAITVEAVSGPRSSSFERVRRFRSFWGRNAVHGHWIRSSRP